MATASTAAVLSHWYTLIDNFQASPKEFYTAVETAIAERQIPETEVSRVDYHEGGILSARREYLRVMRGRYMFDICGAPFGRGFFFSWWLAEAQSPNGPLALVLLILYILVGFAFSFKWFGFFGGLIFGAIGLPVVFWLFVKFMGSAREGWDDPLVAMPLIGPLYERFFRPRTYYKMDTALMFQEAVRSAVLEVTDGLTQAKGIRALSEAERKPILKELFAR